MWNLCPCIAYSGVLTYSFDVYLLLRLILSLLGQLTYVVKNPQETTFIGINVGFKFSLPYFLEGGRKKKDKGKRCGPDVAEGRKKCT